MSNPIKVLHVFSQLNRGGAETMVMNLYRKMSKDQVQFDFVTHVSDGNIYESEILAMGGRVFYMPYYKGYNHFEYKKAWIKFLELHDEFKIIHGHFRTTAFIYLNVARKKGLVTIAHSHSTSEEKNLKGLVISFFQKRIKYISNYNFACSIDAGEWMFGKSKNNKMNYTILKNAIDTDRYIVDNTVRKDIRKSLNIGDNLVIGHVGNFRYAKNHSFILQVFNQYYNTENKNSKLLFLGEGDLMDNIKEQAFKLGLSENILFLGNVENVSDYLQVMDIFVFPSLYEGLGMALIEAQASGLPCIVSNNIPNEAIISTSVKVLTLDIKLWSNAIIEMEKIKKNTKQNVLIKEAGYDIESTAKYIQNFYLDIIEDLK